MHLFVLPIFIFCHCVRRSNKRGSPSPYTPDSPRPAGEQAVPEQRLRYYFKALEEDRSIRNDLTGMEMKMFTSHWTANGVRPCAREAIRMSDGIRHLRTGRLTRTLPMRSDGKQLPTGVEREGHTDRGFTWERSGEEQDQKIKPCVVTKVGFPKKVTVYYLEFSQSKACEGRGLQATHYKAASHSC